MSDQLPHSPETESVVLAALLLGASDPEQWVPLLLPTDFHDRRNRAVFEAIHGLLEQGKSVDHTSVADELRRSDQLTLAGGVPRLIELTDATPGVVHLTTHVESLRHLSRLRQIHDVCREAQIVVQTDGASADPDGLVDDLTGSVARIVGGKPATEVFSRVGDVLRSEVDAIAEVVRARAAGEEIPSEASSTGWQDVDELFGGGLFDGQLCVVAARPGMGKTAFANQVALSFALRGQAVASFSLEMPRRMIALRMLSAHAAVPKARLQHRDLTERDWQDATRSVQQLCNVPLFLDDQAALTVAEIRRRVHLLEAELRRRSRLVSGPERVGLICVDYLQLCRGRRDQGDTREREVASISEDLLALAKDFQVPVLALSQLSRAVEQRKERRPVLQDLRESGTIEQDASLVAFIYNEAQYDSSLRGEQEDAEIIVAKNRNGSLGTARLQWQGRFVRFLQSYDDFGSEFDAPREVS